MWDMCVRGEGCGEQQCGGGKVGSERDELADGACKNDVSLRSGVEEGLMEE